MSTPRIWTVEEANAVVPSLSSIMERQIEAAEEIVRSWQQLLEEMGWRGVEPERVVELARRGSAWAQARERELSEKVAAYEAGWRDVEDLGIVVKDPRTGLCDFYGQVEGKFVWLCWRYGEESVGHYHELDAGFAGRKPITDAARRRLLN